MGKVILSITMSLDGFTAGQRTTQENPISLKGQLLHRWPFANIQKEDEEVATAMFKNCGAMILGSRTYTTAIDGVWESQSPFPVPALVLSLDELHIHIAPKLLGSGTRLFEKENNRIIELTKIKVIETPGATHLFLKATGR